MRATFNPGLQQQHSDVRTTLRYHLARLLLLEQFDQALREAETAYGQHTILAEDLKFVRDVVADATGQGASAPDSAGDCNGVAHHDLSTNTNGHDLAR